ncbi:hypothetical protein L6E12_04280 [Actinokineospora sp. PR83]|uniref:hypothetical protein n=1 Tax=Actinokineospora sp. PR83 TaxID=2884908 RepID=UPI001F2B27EC|nr:hypothetical protein [Actinokineospora sp. PR83]MCG8915006.1 hypothetical protein [Actinokineospora sp. PR83]
MRRLPVAVGFLTALAAGLLVAAPPASAHWSATGSATAAGSTATLAPPTAVTARLTGPAAVAVSWAASTGTPSPTGYLVTRTTGTTTAAACGSGATAPVTGTSCTDTAVPAGTHTYRVVALHRSWTATSAPSGPVVVSTATRLAFTTQPSTVASTASITPSPRVTVQTSTGVAVPVAGTPVTIALGANPNGGTLSGTTTATTDSGGVATFPGLSIDKAATGYALLATSAGLTQATSSAFTVTAGPAAKLAFTTSPGTSFAGRPFHDQPVVQVQDAGGNPVTTAAVTVSQALTTPAGATLACAPKAAVAGVATFTACSVDTVGTYTLTATAPGLTPAVSTPFTTVAAPTRLAWSEPSTTVCTGSGGTRFALTYTRCLFLLSAGTFTARITLTDSSGTPVVNHGPDVVVTLTTTTGSTNPTTLTIPHGAEVSSASTTFSPFYLLNTTSVLTAASPGLTSATAALQSI